MQRLNSKVDNPPVGPVTRTVSNSNWFLLADGTKRFVHRDLKFQKMEKSLQQAELNLIITAACQGDLDVFVRSPRGRVRWIHRSDPKNQKGNLVVNKLNIAKSFSGSNPNGKWKLLMRDRVKGEVARFDRVSLKI